EVGAVVVEARTGVDLPLLVELQRVEHVGADRAGLALRPAAAGAVVQRVADVGVRRVQLGRWPGAAVQRGQRGRVHRLPAQFDAGAQVVRDRTGGEVGGEVELVRDDAVGLVLEVRVAARNRPGRRIAGV